MQKFIITQSISFRFGRKFWTLDTAEQYCRPMPGRSDASEKNMCTKRAKKCDFCDLQTRFFRISRLTVEFGKNDLLHFLIARQLGAACNFSGFSDGSFSRYMTKVQYFTTYKHSTDFRSAQDPTRASTV